MKLKKIAKQDTAERLTANIRHSTVAQVNAYRDYYLQVFGEPIERSRLVDEILSGFMQSDKEFQKFFAEQQLKAGASD